MCWSTACCLYKSIPMSSLLDLPQFFSNESDYPMAYTEVGSGDILLLVHGSLCDYRYWRWQFAALGQHHRVIAPSLRGYWPTALQAQDPRFNVAQHTEDLIRFIRHHLGGQRVHLLGHSRGAHIALEATLKAPDLVRSLVLVDPGFRIEQSSVTHSFLPEIARQLEAGEADTALASFIDTVNGAGTWRHMVSWFKNMVRDNVYTLISQAQEIDLVFEPALTRQLECPVLLLGGENSPPRYGLVIDALIQHIPQAQRDTIAQAAHGMNLANPKAFNERILKFIQHAEFQY